MLSNKIIVPKCNTGRTPASLKQLEIYAALSSGSFQDGIKKLINENIISPLGPEGPFLVKTMTTLEEAMTANKSGYALICENGKVVRIEEDI